MYELTVLSPLYLFTKKQCFNYVLQNLSLHLSQLGTMQQHILRLTFLVEKNIVHNQVVENSDLELHTPDYEKQIDGEDGPYNASTEGLNSHRSKHVVMHS